MTATALSPTEIEVSWEEVPLIDQNGMITTYEVRYTPETRFQDEISTNSVNITNSSVMSITLTGLEEFVGYNISVRAYTGEGPGPYSPDVAERTYSAGERFSVCEHPLIIPFNAPYRTCYSPSEC